MKRCPPPTTSPLPSPCLGCPKQYRKTVGVADAAAFPNAKKLNPQPRACTHARMHAHACTHARWKECWLIPPTLAVPQMPIVGTCMSSSSSSRSPATRPRSSTRCETLFSARLRRVNARNIGTGSHAMTLRRARVR
eukprot:364877-Chlamydomonas_euryale.AAC.1